jgi:alkanesulfonate monooxygenase SsuD/methylene tetrahydromethanopterin reductase-like flavin-dependent oxidoreductase (luciferase family)
LAAQYADEYVITLASVEQCREVRARLSQTAHRHGRTPSALRLALFTPFCIGDQADRRFEEIVEQQPIMARMAASREAWLLGSLDQVRQRICELEEAGVERLMLPVVGDLQREMFPLVVAAALDR